MMLIQGYFFQRLFLIAVAGLFAFAGCSDNNPANEGNPNIFVSIPKPDSEFVYTEYDTEDGEKIDITEQKVTSMVIENGLTYKGKNDVLRLREIYEKGDSADVYIRYESNNDMSLLFSGDDVPFGKELWLTLPFGSKSEQSLPLIDTLLENSNSGFDTLRLGVKTAYMGEETVQYNGSDLTVWLAKITISGTIPLFGQADFEASSTMRFAPSLGFVYSNVETTDDGISVSGSVRTLQSHTLK